MIEKLKTFIKLVKERQKIKEIISSLPEESMIRSEYVDILKSNTTKLDLAYRNLKRK